MIDFKARLLKKELNQIDLSKMLGMNKSALCSCINGSRCFPWKYHFDLSKILGIKMSDLRKAKLEAHRK